MNKKFFQALTLSALVFGIMMSEARSKNEHYNNRELNSPQVINEPINTGDANNLLEPPFVCKKGERKVCNREMPSFCWCEHDHII